MRYTRRVFDKTERQFFAGQDVQSVVQTIQQALYANGIPTQQTGPTTWAGRGVNPVWGLVPKVSIMAAPSPQGFYVDIRMLADIEGGGIAGFIVAWFLFFPVAIILGYMAYQDFTQRQAHLFHGIWSSVGHLIVAPNFAAPTFGAQAGAPPYSP